MELSKDLRKFLVSGAALLMLASSGVAGVSNMNVSAKRRHAHVTRRAHISYKASRVHRTRRHKRSDAPKREGNAIKYKTGKVFILNPQDEARKTQDNLNYLDSEQQAHANDGTAWMYDPSFQESMDQPAVPQQMIDNPSGYAKSIDSNPNITQSTKNMIASLTAGPTPQNDPDAMTYSDQGDGQSAKAMRSAEDANKQAEEQADQAIKAARAKNVRKAKRSHHGKRNVRKAANRSINSRQIFSEAFAKSRKNHSRKTSISKALAAVRYAAMNTLTPQQLVRSAANHRGVSHSQRLALYRIGSTMRKTHKKSAKPQINRVLQLLRTRGDFKGMKKSTARRKANYLRKHPKALYRILSRKNVGAIIYAKNPRNAFNIARKAAKKHPSLKKGRIVATSSKRNARKVALFQDDIIKLAKQDGIQLPQNGVLTINIK